MKSTSEEERKVWICLFTCCSTRAVHFEVIPNMTSEASRVDSVGDLVLVHVENHPRSYWRMGKVERLLMSKNGQSRGAEVRVQRRGSSRGGLLRRPVQLLYPLEVSCSTNEAAPQEQAPESPEQPTQGRARGIRERWNLQVNIC